VKFVFEQPLPSDNVSTRGPRDKTTIAVVDQRLVLVGHRSAPIGVSEGTVIVHRDRRGDRGGEAVALDGAQGSGL
jgi:hypothetical protein